MNYNSNFRLPHGKSYYLVSFISTLVIACGMWSIITFIPELILKPNSFLGSSGLSLFDTFNRAYIVQSDMPFNVGLYAGGVIFWIINGLTLLIAIGFSWFVIRTLMVFLTYNKWMNTWLSAHTEIINSCKNPAELKDKVAMVVPTCNDFLPNTLLQTAAQTYKNLDVWISDDSSNPEFIKKIDEFCKLHNFHVLHRDPEHKKAHPTKVGNLYYWLTKVGFKYDYVFENDSSSIVTPNFVENCMCYFKTPLWNHERDGGIICNGSFYGAQNVISFLTSKCIQFSESFVCGGGANQLLGGPVMINGWGAMYKISTLLQIPLEKVECPICDSARGLWLTLNNYHNYLNPFDFSAKWSPQHMEGLKNQKMKWNGGDVFIFKNGLVHAKYPTTKSNIYVKMFTYQIDILIPALCFISIANAIVFAALNFFYFNLTSTLIVLAIGLVMIAALFIALFVCKANILVFLFSIVGSTIEGAVMYRRVWQILVRGFIMNTWSSGDVTVKANIKSTVKQKIKMSYIDFIVILLTLAVCFVLQFVTKVHPFIIWFNILFIFAGPSMIYFIWVWIGEIKVHTGYSDDMVQYNFWYHDFRYKYVKESEIWKKQHKDLV